ncbi:rhodanese-like domain protein [Mycoplasma sp. CAG:776]|nr:rhodanese-like domain protein [Mycoplasma sp. CAG:776]
MKLIMVVLACFLLLGCSNETKVTYEKIDSKQALEIMNENDKYQILDVRTREEYGEGHLPNAFNLPYDEINEFTTFDKDTILFVYCKSGNRSKIAAEKLLELGYTVYDLGAYEDINLEE